MRRNALWLAAWAGVFVLAVLLVRVFEAKQRGGIAGMPMAQSTAVPVVAVASVPTPVTSADSSAMSLAETAPTPAPASTTLDIGLKPLATPPRASEPVPSSAIEQIAVQDVQPLPSPPPSAPLVPPPDAVPSSSPIALPSESSAPPPTSIEGSPASSLARPAPVSSPVSDPKGTPCPWTFQVSVGKGRTQLEARIGKDVQFLVACDELDMQTPNGQVHAAGNVMVSGPNMEGACSRLTLTWEDERLHLEGSVSLKCRQDGQDLDLAGEQLSVRLAVVETVPPPALAE